jgi:uncharacterized membrane protein
VFKPTICEEIFCEICDLLTHDLALIQLVYIVAEGALTMTGIHNGLARRMTFSVAQHSKTGTRLIWLVSAINFIVPEICIVNNVHLFFSIMTLHVNISYNIRTFKFVDYSATRCQGTEWFDERTFFLNLSTRSWEKRIWKATRLYLVVIAKHKDELNVELITVWKLFT